MSSLHTALEAGIAAANSCANAPSLSDAHLSDSRREADSENGGGGRGEGKLDATASASFMCLPGGVLLKAALASAAASTAAAASNAPARATPTNKAQKIATARQVSPASGNSNGVRDTEWKECASDKCANTECANTECANAERANAECANADSNSGNPQPPHLDTLIVTKPAVYSSFGSFIVFGHDKP